MGELIGWPVLCVVLALTCLLARRGFLHVAFDEETAPTTAADLCRTANWLTLAATAFALAALARTWSIITGQS